MSRIYDTSRQDRDRKRYREAELGQRFNPVQAQNDRTQLEGYAQEVQSQVDTRQRELKREQDMENLELKSEQNAAAKSMEVQQKRETAEQTMQHTYDKKTLDLEVLHQKNLDAMDMAHLKATAAVQNTNLSVMSNAVTSLLSFSQKGLSYIETQSKIAEADKAASNAVNGIFFNSGAFSDLQATAEVEADQNLASNRAGEIAIRDTTTNENLRQDLRQPANQVAAARAGQRNNVYSATAALPGYMSGIMNSSTPIQTPDGRTIIPNQLANSPTAEADLQFLQFYAFEKFAREYGLSSMDAKEVQKVLVPQAKGIMNMNAQLYGAAIAKARKENAINTGRNSVATGLINGQAPGDAFNVYEDVLFRNGTSSAGSVEGATDYIISVAKSEGKREILEQLLQHRVRGSGQKLSEGQSGVKIRAALLEIDKGEIQRSNLISAQKTKLMNDIQATRLQGLMAEGVTPEQEVAINQDAITKLRNIGTTEAINAANAIDRAGDDYNPFFYSQLKNAAQNEGARYSQDQLQTWLSNRDINRDEAIALGWSKDGVKSIHDQVDDLVGNYDKNIENAAKGIVKSSLRMIKDPAEKDTIANTQGGLIASDLSVKLERSLGSWISSYHTQNGTMPSESEVLAQLQTMVTNKTTELVGANGEGGTLTYTAQGGFSGYQFGYGAGQDINNVAPTHLHSDRTPYRDFSQFSLDKLKSMRGRTGSAVGINFGNDRVYTTREISESFTALSKGGSLSPRVLAKAKALNVDPMTLLQMQSDTFGMTEMGADFGALQRAAARPEEASGVAGPQTLREGVQYLQSGLGFPQKGAEYLAANIMQESSWDGMRTWGQVAGDGTSKNGGLISWASWTNDPARLGVIEGYLGKNIKDATHAEQLRAMKWEMQTNPRFRGAYNTFMRPNATDRELRQASMQYWGYGEEGNRFTTYLDQARESSFNPGSSPAGGGPKSFTGALSYQGNEQSYRDIGSVFQSSGFRIGEQSDFDPVDGQHASNSYHNFNEAFDITHQTGDYATSIAKTKRLKDVVRSLGLFREVIGPGDGDPNHETHLHLGGLLRPITAEDRAAIASVR